MLLKAVLLSSEGASAGNIQPEPDSPALRFQMDDNLLEQQ